MTSAGRGNLIMCDQRPGCYQWIHNSTLCTFLCMYQGPQASGRPNQVSRDFKKGYDSGAFITLGFTVCLMATWRLDQTSCPGGEEARLFPMLGYIVPMPRDRLANTECKQTFPFSSTKKVHLVLRPFSHKSPLSRSNVRSTECTEQRSF